MQYTQLLQEFLFAFRYAEMPGQKAFHELQIREDAKQVKQAQSDLRPPFLLACLLYLCLPETIYLL